MEIQYDPGPGLTGFYNSVSQPNLMFTFLKAASVGVDASAQVGRCNLEPGLKSVLKTCVDVYVGIRVET